MATVFNNRGKLVFVGQTPVGMPRKTYGAVVVRVGASTIDILGHLQGLFPGPGASRAGASAATPGFTQTTAHPHQAGGGICHGTVVVNSEVCRRRGGRHGRRGVIFGPAGHFGMGG